MCRLLADQSVSARPRAAARRSARTDDRCRRRHRLRRSVRRSAYVHQYSIDLQRELPGRIAASIGYLGSRSERLAVGGTSDSRVNINQLDPRTCRSAAALQAVGAQSIFRHHRIRRAAPRSRRSRVVSFCGRIRSSRTSSRIGSARPARGTTRSCLSAERRQHDGWGMRVNYTFSVRKDNQFGEGNLFSPTRRPRSTTSISIASSATRRSTRRTAQHQRHVELPFGEGKRWLSAAAC